MTNGHDPEVRTYRGRSLEEVLPRIRAELGPDAVIVRQRDGLMGGIGGFFQQQFVEVEARAGTRRFDAYDDEPALPDALRGGPGAAPAAEAGRDEPVVQPAQSRRDAADAPPAADADAPAPAAPAADGPLPRAARFAAEAEAAAPPPQTPPARQPGRASGRRMTAAELLAQATGARAGDPRTPAEILREHSATFASQLAAAEERAEPAVIANPPDAAEQGPTGRYAPPVPAVAQDDDAAPTAPEATSAAPRRSRTARRARARRRRTPAAAARSAPTAPRAARRADAPATAARPDREADAAAPAAQPAGARPDGEANAAARTAVRPAAARPAAPARSDAPSGGVGPQTTQALELAAALAANVAARGADAAPGEPTPADHAPADPAPSGADSAAAAAPAGPAAAPTPAQTPATPSLPPLPRQAPRRGIFGRRRASAIPLATVAASPAAAAVGDTLAERGVAPAVARDVIADAAAHVLPFAADGDLRAAARTALARRIPTPPAPRLGGRAVAFVGAGGTGKTRCVAGLAAAYAGGSTVDVVVVTLASADRGAELRALLADHGVRVEAFASATAASGRIAQARAASLVVIDTPAVAPSDPAAVAALAAELAPLELDERQLAVPATLGAAVAQEQLERLAPLAPTGIALTHADETAHIGAVVELACATRLPLAYVNSGLALPGALAPADPRQLAERLLP